MTSFFGFSQKFGAVWKLPLRDTSTLWATFWAVRPTWATRVRSISMCSVGTESCCCTWTSAVPGMCRIRLAIRWAIW